MIVNGKSYNLAAVSVRLGKSLKSAPQAFAVLAERPAAEVDQIVGTRREADKEVRDLKKMGFEDAYVKPFATWAEAEAYADKLKGN
jgi:hypothetical protein